MDNLYDHMLQEGAAGRLRKKTNRASAKKKD